MARQDNTASTASTSAPSNGPAAAGTSSGARNNSSLESRFKNFGTQVKSSSVKNIRGGSDPEKNKNKQSEPNRFNFVNRKLPNPAAEKTQEKPGTQLHFYNKNASSTVNNVKPINQSANNAQKSFNAPQINSINKSDASHKNNNKSDLKNDNSNPYDAAIKNVQVSTQKAPNSQSGNVYGEKIEQIKAKKQTGMPNLMTSPAKVNTRGQERKSSTQPVAQDDSSSSKLPRKLSHGDKLSNIAQKEIFKVALENLPSIVNEKDIENILSDFKTNIRLIELEARDGTFTGRCFVEVDTRDAKEILLKMNGQYEMDGQAIKISSRHGGNQGHHRNDHRGNDRRGSNRDDRYNQSRHSSNHSFNSNNVNYSNMHRSNSENSIMSNRDSNRRGSSFTSFNRSSFSRNSSMSSSTNSLDGARGGSKDFILQRGSVGGPKPMATVVDDDENVDAFNKTA